MYYQPAVRLIRIFLYILFTFWEKPMNAYLIKYLFIYIVAFLLYSKLLNSKISTGFYIKILTYSILLTIFTTYYRLTNPLFSVILSYTLFFLIVLLFFRTKFKLGFFTSQIAFCFSHALFIISGSLYTFMLNIFSHSCPSHPNTFTYLFSGIFAALLAYLLLKCKRIKNGLKYIYTPIFVNIVSVLSLLVMVSLTVSQLFAVPDHHTIAIPIYVFLSTFTLLFLWQHQIKHYYDSKLRKLELESLRQELKEKDATIQKILKDNDALARTIHKDNKLLPAMLSAVTEYLESGSSNSEDDRTALGKALSRQLEELAGDRREILSGSYHTDQVLPLTGHAAVDAMLSYMKKRANNDDICYEVKIHPDFSSKTGEEIAEADLSHLLSDLIENALIACKNHEHKNILVHLGILYDVPTIEVSDSGTPFAPEVYQNFGLQKHSTHLGEGGSGIGLMDIWKLKKKYAASLHIYEYEPETMPFTKKISIVFDHRKHFLIRSYRPEEIVKMQTRSDLYIFPLQEDTH